MQKLQYYDLPKMPCKAVHSRVNQNILPTLQNTIQENKKGAITRFPLKNHGPINHASIGSNRPGISAARIARTAQSKNQRAKSPRGSRAYIQFPARARACISYLRELQAAHTHTYGRLMRGNKEKEAIIDGTR